jgi:CubicO group peptidase (beta-lactamase class C family)
MLRQPRTPRKRADPLRSIAPLALSLASALLPGSLPAASGEAGPLPPRLEQDIAAGKLGKIVSVVVEQHGQVRYARSYGRATPQTLHDVRSAGKSLTALAVGIAIAEGKLGGVDAKVWPLLGARPDDARGAITVRDLLTMSSALDCDDGSGRSPGQEEKMYGTRDWKAFALGLPPAAGYARDAKGFGRWSYCTAGVFLLGRVVEAATGEVFDRYVQSRILDPLGIAAVEWRRSPSGEVQSGGQVRMRAGDLAKVGRMVLDRGRWQGRQVVPEAWIAEMLTPHRQVGEHVHYGYLWWFTPVRSPRGLEPSWRMQGNGGNVVAIFRDYDAVVVVQTANYNQRDADERTFSILSSALGALPQP